MYRIGGLKSERAVSSPEVHLSSPKLHHLPHFSESLITRTSSLITGATTSSPFQSYNVFPIFRAVNHRSFVASSLITGSIVSSPFLESLIIGASSLITGELDLVWRRLINIALLDGEEHIEEVVKLIILFLFGYVLFPQGNSMVRSFWARYVDDLQRISDYAWGKRVHEFLVGGLDQFVSRCGAGSSGGSSSYSGCLFGCSAVLMAWLYKHTTLFSPLVPDASPCLFKWGSMGISGS
ncbi:PREDICTED: uncharacterized protein LOC109114851 [Nelumbo nucifera]|uniref:Uncharacterized protein LOC109114851 n=1 Tax=Nelumbo nucifera TaxID=4432 RepID=A0A1U8Q6N6_NELNU|nr:PREDICTED: uncharacterized protein LOC109114851 [Nelumbo nucifera]